MKDSIQICGETFKKKRIHFSFESSYKQIDKMNELKKLQQLAKLETVSLNGTNINDEGLRHLSACTTLSNINLSFTPISDKGIAYLVILKQLKHLRLKETEITQKSLSYFNKMTALVSLQVHETEISGKDMAGLDLASLEELFVDCDDEEDHNTLLALSSRLPSCEIIAKGKGVYNNGVFEA